MSSYYCYYDQEFQKARNKYIEDCYQNLPEKDKATIDKATKLLMGYCRNLGETGAHELLFQINSWRLKNGVPVQSKSR